MRSGDLTCRFVRDTVTLCLSTPRLAGTGEFSYSTSWSGRLPASVYSLLYSESFVASKKSACLDEPALFVFVAGMDAGTTIKVEQKKIQKRIGGVSNSVFWNSTNLKVFVTSPPGSSQVVLAIKSEYKLCNYHSSIKILRPSIVFLVKPTFSSSAAVFVSSSAIRCLAARISA